MERIRIAALASGRGSNFQALVRAGRREEFPARMVLLVTDNPEAGALKHARQAEIESFVIDCGPRKGSLSLTASERICELCRERRVDLVCLAGFMRIVKGRLLEEYAGRMLNIHPALLPSFKGLHAQRQALEYGVQYSGCSVHFIDAGVDTGPIIIQKVVPVLADDTEESLAARILAAEHEAYPEAVRLFAEGRLKLRGRKVLIQDE